jgi:hypothetical protein
MKMSDNKGKHHEGVEYEDDVLMVPNISHPIIQDGIDKVRLLT